MESINGAKTDKTYAINNIFLLRSLLLFLALTLYPDCSTEFKFVYTLKCSFFKYDDSEDNEQYYLPEYIPYILLLVSYYKKLIRQTLVYNMLLQIIL